MYFTNFYIQFSSWKCETVTQFILSWFAVAFAVVVFHSIRYLIFTIEDYMYTEYPYKKVSESIEGSDHSYQQAPTMNTMNNDSNNNSSHNKSDMDTRYFLLRLLHSIISGLNYGLALSLMLIAMTYNPSLLLALIVGYCVGDFMFFRRKKPTSTSSCMECHL